MLDLVAPLYLVALLYLGTLFRLATLHRATRRGIAARLHRTARLGLTTASLITADLLTAGLSTADLIHAALGTGYLIHAALSTADLTRAGFIPAALSAWEIADGLRDSTGADRTGRTARALTARRSRPDRGRAIAFGRGWVLIEAGATAGPVAWEHGTTVEVQDSDADW